MFLERHVETSGTRLRFREAGAGDPVVALDGLPWRLPAVPETLAREYRVLEVALPGNATASESPLTGKEIAALAGPAVSALVDGGYTLVGTSFGASVALWLALQMPEQIEALVLISPVGILPADGFSAADGEDLKRRLFAHPEAARLPEPGPGAAALEQAALARLRSASHDGDLEAALAGVRCPTLVVFGQEDRVVSPEAARIYQDRVPNCNVAWVYDAGHAIAAERPEALAGLVLDYVRRRETFIVETRAGVVNP